MLYQSSYNINLGIICLTIAIFPFSVSHTNSLCRGKPIFSNMGMMLLAFNSSSVPLDITKTFPTSLNKFIIFRQLSLNCELLLLLLSRLQDDDTNKEESTVIALELVSSNRARILVASGLIGSTLNWRRVKRIAMSLNESEGERFYDRTNSIDFYSSKICYLLLWNFSCTLTRDLEDREASVSLEFELKRKYRKVNTSAHTMINTILKSDSIEWMYLYFTLHYLML